MGNLQCSMVIAQCQTVNNLALVSDLAANKRAPEYQAPKKERSYSGAEQRRLFE